MACAASTSNLGANVGKRGCHENIAVIQGLWTDDGVDVWTIETSGRALFNGEWVGRMFDLCSVPSMHAFVRGDGWALFLRDATDKQLVWRKRGQQPIRWTRYAAASVQAGPAKMDECESEASTEDVHSNVSGESECGADRGQLAFSHVRFDLSNIVIFEVTPYSEVYGMHPREFDFDADYSLVPVQQSGRQLSCERHLETESEGPEEEAPRMLSLEALL
jgi:hypothetical protein